MAGVKIAKFDAIVEKNAVTLPVKAVGEEDFALGAGWNVG
jgi:hypothetical protein